MSNELFSSNNLHDSLHRGLPFSLTLFIATSWDNLSLPFDFNKGKKISFFLSVEILSPTKKNESENEQNTQAILLSCKT